MMRKQPLTEKWRPKVMEDLIGQLAIIRLLINWLINGANTNLLLVGPTGCGKTSVAYILARELNKQLKGMGSLPQLFTSHYIEDGWKDIIVELSGSRITRYVIDNDLTKYLQSSFKHVIFIDEADALNASDQESLRKLMEGVHNAVFILATNLEDKIQKAIKSRCVVITFKPIPIPLVAKKLRDISIAEGFCTKEPTPAENRFLLRLAQRSGGDLRVINQLELYVKNGRFDPEMINDEC